MKTEQFRALSAYKAAVSQAKIMLKNGLITCDEYIAIETKMHQKYGITSCSLLRDNDWINCHLRGNMSPTKEVVSCLEQ